MLYKEKSLKCSKRTKSYAHIAYKTRLNPPEKNNVYFEVKIDLLNPTSQEISS